MPLRPTIVFDLDGTLVETAPDLVDTLNLIFTQERLPPILYEVARTFVGGGIKPMIERGLLAEGRDYTPQSLDDLFARFLVHYTAHIADRSRAFPGADDTLNELNGRGYHLAVCTNKLERLAMLLLDTLGLRSRFSFVCGQDTFDVKKPDGNVLLRTIAAAGGDPKMAIMVGDSETDILTARSAGIPVVALDFGYSERPVKEFSPDLVISHFHDLTRAIDGLLPRQ